ncbi:hypothetical protein FHS78_002650 [Parvibaculum indicum]|uniref:hypothetical protein n=1 Tax=Parvibaculum indicum TaxID=562969 RepID=UPI001423046C|nr:hypothetical protein [Parvibaculum indicum]NIJ42356.1 hypothetical protein [Parvibaculum indicum]
MPELISCLAKWQTLISGSLAVLAATGGSAILIYQIRQAKSFESDRLDRRHKAARALLPLVLSALIDYSRSAAADLKNFHLASHGNVVDRNALNAWQIPPVPHDEIRTLTDVVEAASNEVATAIADLIGDIQVQAARLRGLQSETRVTSKTDLEEYILDVAEIYAQCENMFDYARRETDIVRPEIKYEDMRRSLRLMNFYDAQFGELMETVARRYPQNQSA